MENYSTVLKTLLPARSKRQRSAKDFRDSRAHKDVVASMATDNGWIAAVVLPLVTISGSPKKCCKQRIDSVKQTRPMSENTRGK
jgi:hypothetical protein